MADAPESQWCAADIKALAAAFEAGTLPRACWTHAAHLAVALWTLSRLSPEAALTHLRERIRGYNAATGTANSDHSGYHETITRWFLQEVAEHMARHADLPLQQSLEHLLRSPLAHPSAPLRVYPRQRLWSVQARRGWVEPEPPVLYSFRRCPYAIRARLALAAAGLVPGEDLELREASLKAKPPELLAASAKATVPVLVHGDQVIEESLDVMRWALELHDPQGWLRGWSAAEVAAMEALIGENDGPFKHHLDRFKYADRFASDGASGPGTGEAVEARRRHHGQQALAILRRWGARLERGGWLLGRRPSLADWSLLPFVRQFRLADTQAFDAASDLEPLQLWLERFLAGPELAAVLDPPWAFRSPWPSPSWLYHLALRSEWQAARTEGVYRRSTRGRSLEQVGFIHLSQAHQLAATHGRFYADLDPGAVVLLAIDPERLAAAGLAVRLEPAPGSGELFPHLHGPLPAAAVVAAWPWSTEHGVQPAARW
jgi:glutathione S-transferase